MPDGMRNNRNHNDDNRDVVSLFSGAMGLDLGLVNAGLRIATGQEIDKSCIETIRANGHRVLPGDIRGIHPREILEMANLRVGQLFLVCGGPPCQPFSTAGKRRGISDPRGSLFMDFIRVVDYIRPRFFIMENVKGLKSAALRHTPIAERGGQLKSADREPGTVLKVILEEFSKLGYKTVYGILDAVNYGVPQFRERFFMMGSRDNEDIFLPMPTHFRMHQNSSYQWNTLRPAIGDLETSPGEHAQFSAERLRYLKMIPQGGNWRDLPDELQEEAMGGAYRSGGGKVGFFRRLSYCQPAPTLLTSPVQKASMLCHPTQDRPLSVKEYARIQQFPDNWVFAGNMSAKYKQIGNAVPVGLAEALGRALLAVADGCSTIQTKRVQGTAVHRRIQNAMREKGL